MKSLFVAALLFTVGCNAGEMSKANKKFVETLDGCGFDHGYVCMAQDESDFIGMAAAKKMVPGNYLKAFASALDAFQNAADLDEEQRDLKHYKVGFSENPTQYVVHFQALLLPEVKQGKATGISRSALGQSTRYWINKQTLEVEQRLFYK